MVVKPQTVEDVYAPFNFVPLSERVFFPDWADQVSHDIPFKDGYCGEIEIELEAETPLLIGGEVEDKQYLASDGKEYTERLVKFLIDPDKKYVIPGSSLKGMVRSVLEIASFSKMKMVDDARLSVRDLSRGGSFYTNKFTASDKRDRNKKLAKPKSGWLYLDGSSWKLAPCHYARIDSAELVAQPKAEVPSDSEDTETQKFRAELDEVLTKLKNPATPAGDKVALRARRDFCKRKLDVADTGTQTLSGTATNRTLDEDATLGELYDRVESLLSGCGHIFVKDLGDKSFPLPHNQNIQVINRMCTLSGPDEGKPAYLVITGQVRSKTKEFVFYAPESQAVELSPEVIDKFQQAYTEKLHPQERIKEIEGAKKDTPWGYWWRKLSRGEVGPESGGMPGVPVFYLTDGDQITSLGLSLMYKLPYDNTVHDMIKNSAPDHLSEQPDLSELVFGKVSEDVGKSFASRVSFGHAGPVGSPGPVGKHLRTVLASPNPQYYPVYVDQDADEHGYLRNRRLVGKYQKSNHTYLTYMKEGKPKIRGWKRYLPHGLNPDAGDAKGPAVSHLEPLKAGSKFRSKITFHNLTKVELGALLWSVSLGGGQETPSGSVHGLGMGKAIGLGQVSVKLCAFKYRKNGSKDWVENDVISEVAHFMSSFASAMAGFLGGDTPDHWCKSPQIQSLALMSSKSIEADAKLRLQYMKIEFGGRGQNQFVNAKNDGKVLPNVMDRLDRGDV